MNNLVIRIVAIASLTALLALVLYLPSAHPPSRFMAQIRAEYAVAADVWGAEHALHIMARMLDMQTAQAQVSAVPAAMAAASAASAASSVSPVDAAMAAQIGQMGKRLFSNSYFKSIDALLALALYRFSVWIECLPVLLVFGLLALADGLLVRVVRSKVFVQHNPEMFALHASLAIVVSCLSVVACVLPVFVHPYWLAAAPFLMGVCANRAVANYHRRS